MTAKRDDYLVHASVGVCVDGCGDSLYVTFEGRLFFWTSA